MSWHWGLFVIAWIICTVVLMLVRGATSEANSYQANPGSGMMGSVLAGGVLAAVWAAAVWLGALAGPCAAAGVSPAAANAIAHPISLIYTPDSAWNWSASAPDLRLL